MEKPPTLRYGGGAGNPQGTVKSRRIRFLEEFLDSERAEGKAPATLRNHRRGLEKLERWLVSCNGKCDQSVSPSDLVGFVLHIRDKHPPDHTNNIISAARVYFRWLVEMGLREDEQNPARRLKFQPAPPEPIEALSEDDIRRLLIWAKKAGKERFGVLRSAVLTLLLLDCGLRIGEALALRLEDVDLPQGRLLVNASKTKSLRSVPLSAPMQGHLHRYLTRRKIHFDKRCAQQGGFLFPAEHGGALSVHAAEVSIRHIARRTGVPVRPHKCRHSFARLALMNGMPLSALMNIAGWRQVKTAMRYTTLTNEQCAQVHRQTSPLAGLGRR
jgi:integrase/recombinase XerD